MTPPRRTLPLLCLAAGVAAGSLGTLLFAPALAKTAKAEVTDRTDKFVLFTSRLGLGQPAEGVFILDTSLGALYGGVLGSNGRFVTSYGRNIAADFGQRQAGAEYAAVAATNDSGNGVIYIAENRSGMVVAYAVPDGRGQNLPLVPADKFNFKQAMP